MKKILIFALTVAVAISSLASCSDKTKLISDKSKTLEMKDVETVSAETAYPEFSVKMLQNEFTDENLLLSPISIYAALAMTANGADGDTLKGFEKTLLSTPDEINTFLKNYLSELTEKADDASFSVSNSLWIKKDKDFEVKEDFLNMNKTYFGADVFEAAFDNNTLKDVNSWIKNKTDGRIKDAVEDISEEAVMFIINALTFDGVWAKEYYDVNISDGLFVDSKGNKQKVDYMNSMENYYIETENGYGVKKDYKGGKYSFVAMLPSEKSTLEQLVKSLDGKKFTDAVIKAKQCDVSTKIPKFTVNGSLRLKETLSEIGLAEAFDDAKADFSKISTIKERRLFIDDVLHKTYISVNEKGTEAGAATIVEMEAGAAMPDETEIKEVYLTKPFVYAIVDNSNGNPLFLGIMNHVE